MTNISCHLGQNSSKLLTLSMKLLAIKANENREKQTNKRVIFEKLTAVTIKCSLL